MIVPDASGGFNSQGLQSLSGRSRGVEPSSGATGHIRVKPLQLHEDRLPWHVMTVLIVGGSGFLGTELVRQASAAGYVTAATYATRPGSVAEATWYDLDLRDERRVEEVVA